MDPDDRLHAAINAALAAGAAAGHHDARPVVLQHTNNVVVWLSPFPIVAKVGVWMQSRRLLQRESEVCAQLVALGSPVPEPVRDSGLRRDHGLRPGAGRFGEAQLPVSLWRQLNVNGAEPSPGEVAALLRRVHADLDRCDLSGLSEPVPSLAAGLDTARQTLLDDGAMAAMAAADLDLLRSAFDRWSAIVASWPGGGRLLHGEPHGANILATSHGLVLIDFEWMSVGPLEWDLASLDQAAVVEYGDHDLQRLTVCRALNSARLATWCWSSTEPSMRAYGVQQLAAVVAAVATGL